MILRYLRKLSLTTFSALLASALSHGYGMAKIKLPKPRNGAKAIAAQPYTESRHCDYIFRVHQDELEEDGRNEPPVLSEILLVLKRDDRIFAVEDHRVEVNPSRLALVSSELDAANTLIVIDVIGDGIPNVVVETYSGGVHCCFSYFKFELGEHFRLINRIDAGD